MVQSSVEVSGGPTLFTSHGKRQRSESNLKEKQNMAKAVVSK